MTTMQLQYAQFVKDSQLRQKQLDEQQRSNIQNENLKYQQNVETARANREQEQIAKARNQFEADKANASLKLEQAKLDVTKSYNDRKLSLDAQIANATNAIKKNELQQNKLKLDQDYNKFLLSYDQAERKLAVDTVESTSRTVKNYTAAGQDVTKAVQNAVSIGRSIQMGKALKHAVSQQSH